MANDISTTQTKRPVWLGFLLAALAAIGFSSKAILVKLAYVYSVDAVSLLTLRMLFSMPVFLLVAIIHSRQKHLVKLTLKDYFALLLLGLSGYYLSSLFDFMGLQYISAGLERLILFLYPTMVVVLSGLFLGKAFGRKEIIALALSYAGIAVVFYDELHIQAEHLFLGAGLVFTSTLTYSFYLLGTGEFVHKIGASRFTAYAMLVASMAVFIQFALTQPLQALQLPMVVYQYSLIMAIVSTVLPVFMLSAAIRIIGSGHTSMVGALGPVVTLFLANVFLGESLTNLQITGAGLVMLGVFSLMIK